MNIRVATADDLMQVKKITHETIEGVYSHYYPKGVVAFFLDYHSEKQIRDEVQQEKVFVLEGAMGLVGTVSIMENEVHRLFVPPQHQYRGYGSKLLEFSEEKIMHHFQTIRLDASLPAKEMYLKRGYKEVDTQRILTQAGDYLCYDIMEKYASKVLTNIDYDGKVFAYKVDRTQEGMNQETLFRYHQNEEMLLGEYNGGTILRGNLMGSVSDQGVMEYFYQHVTTKGQQCVGKSICMPRLLEDGRVELGETWRWLNGKCMKGYGTLVEIK